MAKTEKNLDVPHLRTSFPIAIPLHLADTDLARSRLAGALDRRLPLS